MITPASHVYVHVPFCARRCSYCDFSIAVRRDVPVSEYVDALRRELAVRTPTDTPPVQVSTLYLGGGTPSHLGPDGVSRTMDLLREHFCWDGDAEVTIEANPDDVTTAAVAQWTRAGITRVSLGAQSFDDRVLAWMHRTHDAARIRQAVEVVQQAALASWSFDLIFSLPASLERDWERDLALALATDPPHLSLYGLTVEQGTPLGKWNARGEVTAADDGQYEEEFLRASAAAAAAGLEHYEVSNFARPGHRARHNSAYWARVPYLALGPAAHGFDGVRRRWNIGAYAAWRDATLAGADPVAGSELIDPTAISDEAVYLGLRTIDGLLIDEADRPVVRPWIDAGWAVLTGARLRLSPRGWLRLDSLAATLTRARDDR